MTIRIVTDSTAEFSKDEESELSIDVLPLYSIFGDEIYRDGIDLTPEQFFVKLADAKQLPTTSQVTPQAFEQIFTQANPRDDQIIVIVMSAELSGSHQSAVIAREKLLKGSGEACAIHIIDSGSTAMGLHILVRRAVELRDSAVSVESIVATLEREKQDVCLLIALDTLEYLQKGGRISKTSSVAGTMLNMKPLVLLRHGKLGVLAKSRGMKRALERTILEIRSLGGINLERPYALCHTGALEALAQLEQLCTKHFSTNITKTYMIGSVLGTHAGPGAVAIAFFAK